MLSNQDLLQKLVCTTGPSVTCSGAELVVLRAPHTTVKHSSDET